MTMAWNQGDKRKGYPRPTAASEAGTKRISAETLLVAAILVSTLILLATFLPVRTSSLSAPVRNNSTFAPHEIGSAALGAAGQAGRQG